MVRFVEAGDAGGGVVEGVGGAAVVAQDLPALEAGEGVFDPGSDPAVGGVAVFLPGGWRCPVVASPVGHDHLRVAVVAAVGHDRPPRELMVDAGVAECGAALWLPGWGRPTAMTSRVFASMATCRLVE